MQNKKKVNHVVHVFTQKTSMRFIPKIFSKIVTKAKIESNPKIPASTTSRFSLSSIWNRNTAPVQKASSAASQINIQPNSQSEINVEGRKEPEIQMGQKPFDCRLKFATKISNQHILIGNQYQLDLINILGINGNKYVQTEYLWPLRFKEPIEHVNVDKKKFNLLTIVSGKILYIYKYDAKKLTENSPLIPFQQVILLQSPIFVQVVKDGNICLFYKNKLEVYIVAEKVRRRYDKNYDKPDVAQSQKCQYLLFLVPDPLDNVINIFFQQKNKQNQKIFTLWCIEMEILASEVKSGPPQKIYDIKSGLRKTLTIRNYSKEIFLLNLGSQILAVKKGYILDSANVNLKHEQSLLEYIGNEQILHITKKKIEIYSFIINTNVKPNKITLKPKDSIKINQNQENLDEYFKVFQILTDDLIFIFQRSSQKILSKSGEIQYSFYITRATTRENKMNELFPKGADKQFKIDDPVLMDKCDMAQKMGFTTREIYLQLWSRSHQARKEDFKILVATKDYNTIKQEIIRKLKKASMNFKQIRDIEQACFFMLHQRVFSPSCTEEAVMDYISSHFFRRKLEMFKDLQQMEKFQKQVQTGKEENQIFKMTIRQYQQYKSMSIKTELISLVNQFCHEGKKKLSKNIRLLLRNFKFVFRIIYYEILEQIIHTSKDKLLALLQQIPELLPYNSPEHETSLYIPGGFYDGVWTQITKQEQASSLFVDAITTIDNKQIVLEQVIKNIIFKRNWLSQHDMVTESRDKIKANYQKIKSPLTFYFFAAKIFEYVQDQKVLKSIVQFLEKTYELPQNLVGNMFLIKKLYNFFQERGIAPEINGRPITLNQFFSFEDKQLIRHCFDKQRSNKGLLLKDIKNIFKQVLKEQASFKYNTALLNYFTSDLSQVSDLKYILNRINNQKVEFHEQNQSMYEVLVEALERKLKIGTDNDIPIEEVLIYIQNIPLKFSSSPSKSLNEVKKVEKIDREGDLLRQAKVDMSIYDIIHNHEQVFTKLINHAIKSSQKQVWESQQQFSDFAIRQIAILQTFAEQIYDNDEQFSHKKANEMIFFIFLAKISEETNRIKFANYLIQNKDFQERFYEYTAQNLVLFMKKWKLTLQKQYRKNEEYIEQLLKLLPEDQNSAIYIRCQVQFARILSAPEQPVTYPISENNCTVMSSDLRDIIFELPPDFLLKIDIPHLYETIQKMQEIFLANSDQEQLTIMNKITLHQIYEYIIIKLINCNKLKEVLPIIRKILTIEIADTTHNIIYMMLFIIQISPEFNQTNKNNLLHSMSFYFYQPIALLEIMEYLLNNRLNSSQVKKFLEDSLEKGKRKNKSYNQSNSLFQQQHIKSIHSKEDEENFMATLQKTGKCLQQAKQEFKNIKYSAIMIMLCNSPYSLAKFISCSYNYEQHIKSLRSFLSYAINQSVFKPYSILELGKRIFYILLEASQKKEPIESVIERYQSETLENDLDMQNYTPPKDKDSFQYIMWKSAQAFKKKKMAYKPEKLNVQKQIEIGKEQGQASHPSEYPFTQIDSDNQLNQQMNQSPKKLKVGQLKKLPTFNASLEMNLLLQQNDKGNKLFRSTRAQGSYKTNNNLSVSIRQPNRSAPTNNFQQTADLKYQHKLTKQKFFDQVGQLNQSQDFNERLDCKTDRQQKLRPSSSVISSDPRRSADSSPEILLNRFDQRCVSGQDPFSLQRLNQREVQKSFEDDQRLQQSRSNASNIYAIQVKQAFDPEEMQEINKNISDNINQQQMIQSTELGNPLTQIVSNLIAANRDALDNPLADFDLTSLDFYSNDKPLIQSVIRALYREYVDLPNLNKIMKLMGAIVNFFPACQINADIFNSLIKAQQVQSKTIPQIPFGNLITELTITYPYDSKRHLFDELYKNLKRHIDSQNIYKITQFIRRVFDDNSDFEQEVTWDFILELCDKLQNCEEEDKNWNVQKIQATLPKVQVHIWSSKLQDFREKVLQSPCKDLLLQIFCNYLGYKKGDGEVIQFLENLLELDDSNIIRQTLDSVK